MSNYLNLIKLPDGTLKVGDDSDTNGNGLKDINNIPAHVEIPFGVTIIGRKAFYQCIIGSVSFPSSLIEIRDSAFDQSQIQNETFEFPSSLLKLGHYSFPANDKDFFFDQNTSIINNCLSFAINCSSSIKIISLSPKNQYALSNYQFDVERCLSGLLKRNYKNLEYYSTSIIGKNEQECLFIVYIGFVFYHDTKNRWFTAFIIINIPAERKPYKIIHQESVSYNIRPPGNKLKETINQWKMEFTLIANPGKNEKIQFLTNVNVDGVDIHGTRLIKAPEMNLIIADERNGKIIF